MNDFFTSFYVPEKYHFGMDDTVVDISGLLLRQKGALLQQNLL